MIVRVLFSSRGRQTRSALVTGVQTCTLPIALRPPSAPPRARRQRARPPHPAPDLPLPPSRTGATAIVSPASRQTTVCFPSPCGCRLAGSFPPAERAGAQNAHAAIILSSPLPRSEEHTSELQSLMRIPSAVLFLKKKQN